MNVNGLINKHVAQLLFYLCLYERLVTFTSLKIGVSTVPWYSINCIVETKLRQKAPYFYELIVENINYYGYY